MARIVIYDPTDETVANRVVSYLLSVNTPDYDGEPNKLVNPDLSSLASVPMKYWKYDGISDIVEMNASEKTAIDDLLETAAKAAKSPKKNKDGIQYVTQMPQSFDISDTPYQLTDRDLKLKTCIFDSAAALTISGIDSDGDVIYNAVKKGEMGNDIRVEHIVGITGAGNENRNLAVTTSGKDITITFGTDGAGDTLTPDATTVADAVNTHSESSALVTASAGGTGASDVSSQAFTNLSGGANPSNEDFYMDPTTNKEKRWDELTQVAIYKDSGGTMVPCTSQADADSNGILTVWEICAIDRKDGITMIPWNVRQGELMVDSGILANLYDHRVYAIAAPDIPLSLGGQVSLFDGYLGPLSGKDRGLQVSDPTAKLLDPSVSPAAAIIRIWLRHPAGVKNTHVMKLVTYRPAST